MEDEVSKIIIKFVEDDSHKFIRPHAGGIKNNKVYELFRNLRTCKF